MKLYNYFRSSASFRVRIALHLKGLAYDYLPVHLARGEQKKPAFAAVTAEGLVPVLELDDDRRLTQSMAIIEYLDETHPQPPLLPADALGRAKNAWYRHWVRLGLESYEAQLATRSGLYSHGDAPTLADCCLVPQIFNAQRFDCDLNGLPRTMAVFDACMKLDAFQQAQPSACPDAEA